MCYDAKLKKINFFKLHPQYLPYIGEKYDEYKILQIGESHYIEQSYDEETDKYDIDYFKDNWFISKCLDLLNDYPWQFNTRMVINNFRHNKGKFYSIFANFARVFNKVHNISIEKEVRKKSYDYIAFTDLYMIPSFYKGKNIESSIIRAAIKKGYRKEFGYDFLKIVELESVQIIDEVIDILNPEKIIFTSSKAGKVYKNYNGKYANDSRAFYSVHPGCVWWNKASNGKKAVEEFLRR